jgi:hypothetical protein
MQGNIWISWRGGVHSTFATHEVRRGSVLLALFRGSSELPSQLSQCIRPALQPLSELYETTRPWRADAGDPRVQRRVAQPCVPRELRLRDSARVHDVADERLKVLLTLGQRILLIVSGKP